MSTKIQGIGIGKRKALGRAYRYVRSSVKIQRKTITELAAERRRLSASADNARANLSALADGLRSTDEHGADILVAQMEFLDDPGYLGEIENIIETEKINAEAAVDAVCGTLVQEFMEIDDEYFRERASDIKDISSKLIADLSGVSLSSLSDIRESVIIVAEDLLPSDTAQLHPDYVLGFCTEKGTATSHTALLANSLGIPAVVGCGNIPSETGDSIIIDGADGTVSINPPADIIAGTKQEIIEYEKQEQERIAKFQAPVITRDGRACAVHANVASAAEAERARQFGADGSGLLRTEFFFYQESSLPNEDRQFEMYAEIAETFGARPITIRTLDIGGDKPLPTLQADYAHEQNPFLGVRGVRLTDTQPDLFASQLRAIIRVATECRAEMKVMFPFVSTVEEVQKLCETMKNCHRQLEEEQGSSFTRPQVGVMIEIPSAALMIDKILSYVDFVSIGTNDLAQYTCAVDRTNERVNMLADYCHPAVLKLIGMVLDAGQRCGKNVSVCGEIAGDPLLIPLLYGMGLRSYSMSAIRIPRAKEILAQVKMADCTAIAETCLNSETISEVRDHLQKFADTYAEHNFQ
ncbi:MAG: phosphoenolpyruvate--protein phosphotransferase [Salinispira sp.]